MASLPFTSLADGGPKKEQKKQSGGSKSKTAEADITVAKLDIRVGLIRKAEKHPDADSLYVEEIDVGEDTPRTVVSGLVKFIPLEEMQVALSKHLFGLSRYFCNAMRHWFFNTCYELAESESLCSLQPETGGNAWYKITRHGFGCIK